jgi:hypothetical protein
MCTSWHSNRSGHTWYLKRPLCVSGGERPSKCPRSHIGIERNQRYAFGLPWASGEYTNHYIANANHYPANANCYVASSRKVSQFCIAFELRHWIYFYRLGASRNWCKQYCLPYHRYQQIFIFVTRNVIVHLPNLYSSLLCFRGANLHTHE